MLSSPLGEKPPYTETQICEGKRPRWAGNTVSEPQGGLSGDPTQTSEDKALAVVLVPPPPRGPDEDRSASFVKTTTVLCCGSSEPPMLSCASKTGTTPTGAGNQPGRENPPAKLSPRVLYWQG